MDKIAEDNEEDAKLQEIQNPVKPLNLNGVSRDTQERFNGSDPLGMAIAREYGGASNQPGAFGMGGVHAAVQRQEYDGSRTLGL